ncbi:hypothetical protein [Dialister sp.]|uniref:hypothetical protein n=1 Tax=Dialister sp. TaxID=1955814 RepID=UPI003F08A604
MEKLLSSVSHGLGTEWTDEKWIFLSLKRLNEAFHQDFHDFNGTAEVYIRFRKQGISLPE